MNCRTVRGCAPTSHGRPRFLDRWADSASVEPKGIGWRWWEVSAQAGVAMLIRVGRHVWNAMERDGTRWNAFQTIAGNIWGKEISNS